ncbi:MAG: hypothetical protein RSF70_07710 [Ruthenibacterium sp.]
MLTFVQTVLPFAALCVLCAFVAYQFHFSGAFAPLLLTCGTMLYLVFCGYLGFLQPAMWLYLIAAAAAFVYLAMQRKKAQKGSFKRIFAPGFVLFCAVGVGLILLFSIRQPMMQEWDEFSLWGTAAKLTKENDMIYSAAPIGWYFLGTQKAGFPTFSYLFNFFGEYAAWRVYAAYDILLVSVWAAAMGALDWKAWKLLVPTSILMFLLPYFCVYQRDIYCNFTYLSAYGDIPMGILMGGVFAWYYHAKHSRVPLWPVCLILGAVTLCKDTGMPLALIAAGILTVDLLLCDDRLGNQKLFSKKIVLPKLATILAMFASVAFVFKTSSMYLASLGSDQSSVGGVSDFSPITVVLEGLKMLFGFAPSAAGAPFADKFNVIRDEMIRLFLPGELHQITMVGCGLFVMLFIWAILALTMLLTTDKIHRRSTALYGVFSTLGFFAYYAFIGFTYVFVFKNEGTGSIIDYNRYINTYYVAWLCGAVVLLVVGALKGSRRYDALTGVTLVLCAGLFVRFSRLVQPQLCVIDYPDSVYTEYVQLHADTRDVTQEIEPDARTYYINQTNHDGAQWFRNSYEFVPYVLAYSHGGGNFGSPAVLQPEILVNNALSAAEWAAELVTQRCDYVYLDETDDLFWNSYASLFSDGGAGAKQGKTKLYAVKINGNPQLLPVTAEEVYFKDTELSEKGEVLPWKSGEKRQKLADSHDVTLVPVEMKGGKA